MKIVFIIPNMTGGGTERVISLLANEYVSRGIEVDIMQFAGYENAYPLDARVNSFSIASQSKGNMGVCIKRLLDMRAYFRKNRGCYVFSFSTMGTVFAVAAALFMKQYILVSERNDPRYSPHLRLRDWSYARANCVTVQTKDCGELFSEKIQRKTVVIPNPVAADLPQRFLGIRKKRIVNVARLHPQKNHMLLLEAFADFARMHPEYELAIYGKGEMEQKLHEKARELQIEDKVQFMGFSPNVKEEILDSAMFVLSSDFEGISNSLLEAMAMGVPVISTDCPIGGSRMFIKSGENGLLISVGQKEELVKAMCAIVEDEAFARKLSVNGSEIRKQYGIDTIADRFLELLKG